ncbi:hypothetical protein GQ457_05G027420 [Hibiscus cannabinus]
MTTVAMHKWEKFVTHPGSVEPNQKAINVTLAQEFYAHLTSPTQSSVYVRGEHIQFTATKINKFYGLQNTADNHSKFVSGLKGKSKDFLLEDLCIPDANWDSANTSVDRDRLGITAENIPSLMGFDETAPAKQPMGGAPKVAAAKLAALTTMVENTRYQFEGLRTDLRTYFNYVKERDQVIKANFDEMLPQSSLNFPAFPQDLLKPTETKMPEHQPTQPTAEHATDQPQDKPLGSDSASSSPTPPDATPQHQLHRHKEGRGKNQQLPQQRQQWRLILRKLQHLRRKNLSTHPHHLLQPPMFEEGPKEQPSVSLLMTARRRCNPVLERKTNQRSYHQPTRRA